MGGVPKKRAGDSGLGGGWMEYKGGFVEGSRSESPSKKPRLAAISKSPAKSCPEGMATSAEYDEGGIIARPSWAKREG